jgi:hypothetical protein|nr:MAG: hypothetical protein [Bacteriophage sp.]DAG98788.1 MAG TPA: Proteasome subunit alpha type-1 [Herelleviridae sp.]
MEVSLLEWEQILDVMLFYHRTEGYIDEVNGKVQFFDRDPCINGVHAYKVTIDEVKEYIRNYGNN